MTQRRKEITTNLGFAAPDDIREINQEKSGSTMVKASIDMRNSIVVTMRLTRALFCTILEARLIPSKATKRNVSLPVSGVFSPLPKLSNVKKAHFSLEDSDWR